MVFEFSIFILGIILLFFGGDFLIRSIKSLSCYFKIKPLFFSIFLLGVGTSAPEWFVTVFSSLEGLPDLALGNVVGSNISNIGLILGFFGLFRTSSFSRSLVKFDFPFLIFSFFLVIVFSIGGFITFFESLILLLVFVAYIFLAIQKRKTEDVSSLLSDQGNAPLLFTVIFIVFGFVFLFLGSYFVVNSVVELGNEFGLSERFIGIFILSVGTSLPELAVSLQALFKKEEEMALGNIIGSNLFNTLFVLGSAGVLSTIAVSPSFLRLDYWIMLAFALFIWLVLIFFKSIPRVFSGFALLSYCAYIAFLFL